MPTGLLEKTTMPRLDALVMLGRAVAACAMLGVPWAHAGPQSPTSEAWSKDEMAVLASLSLKRLPDVPVDPSNAVERLPEIGRAPDGYGPG